MPAAEKHQILKSRYPEFEPLARDFVNLQTALEDLKLAAKAAEAVVKHKSSPRKRKLSSVSDQVLEIATPVAVIKFRALSAYLGTVGMYFALLTSTSSTGKESPLAMPPGELREHPVVDSLAKCRQLWEKVKDTPLPEIEDLASEVETQVASETPRVLNGDIATHLKDSAENPKQKQKTKAQRVALAAQAAAEADRIARIKRTEASLADLSSLVPASQKAMKLKTVPRRMETSEGDSDFGDEAALTAHEAAEKAQRKKSLRFYTSQIAQKSNKRGSASRDAGGDADLPYKERLKDRQARLMREAEKRGQRGVGLGEQLDGDSGNEAEEMRLAKEIRGDVSEDEDGYYDMVATKSKQKKADKKALAEAYAEAAKQGGQVHIEEVVGRDGKRAITYAIAKNKGLAPKRKKEVRNPRVKKRKKYDEKMKKLGSMRQVYKGGEGRGGYGGELTGIKKNLVKSVKL